MAKKLRLVFDNLPLVEAAVRSSFSVPKPLSFSLINSVHSVLKSEFPALVESSQLEVAPGAAPVAIELGPGYVPGAVYTGHAKGISVHVHPQVIVARWSVRPGQTEPRYPHFEALRDALLSAVDSFLTECKDDRPAISVVNMSYVNFISASDPASVLTKYFSAGAHLGLMNGARQIRKLEGAWGEDETLDVRFSIEQAAAKLPEGVTQGYRVTTVAGLRLGAGVDTRAGLEKVHDRLQEFFNELISEEAKSEWRLRKPVHA